jgi:hypothetical protein
LVRAESCATTRLPSGQNQTLRKPRDWPVLNLE